MSDGRWVPTLQDYLDMAEVALDSDVERLCRRPRLELAESAIHAPFASFGSEPTYHELVDQPPCSSPTSHRTIRARRQQAAAFVLTARFLDANGRRWKPEDIETDAGDGRAHRRRQRHARQD